MKTSLNLDDFLLREAKKEAAITGKTVSEIVSFWANRGREFFKKKSGKKKFKPLSLGKQNIDLDERKSWMEELE